MSRGYYFTFGSNHTPYFLMLIIVLYNLYLMRCIEKVMLVLFHSFVIDRIHNSVQCRIFTVYMLATMDFYL